MRVELFERILEDGSKYDTVVNLDTVCCFQESIVPGAQGCLKGKAVLTLANGMVLVVNETFAQMKKIMSVDRK